MFRIRDENVELFGGLSRKTRFPMVKDRYSYRLGSALPNLGLAAESSDNLELRMTGRFRAWNLHAALFRSDLDDAIDAVTLVPTACMRAPCFQLQNIGEARRAVCLRGRLSGSGS